MPLVVLKRRRDFLAAAASGRKWVAPGVIVQARARTAEEPLADGLRFGFTVTKKVGNAVIRNRAKRRLRAAARLAAPGFAPSPTDLVLIGRAETLLRPFALLSADVTRAFEKLGLGRAPS